MLTEAEGPTPAQFLNLTVKVPGGVSCDGQMMLGEAFCKLTVIEVVPLSSKYQGEVTVHTISSAFAGKLLNRTTPPKEVKRHFPQW